MRTRSPRSTVSFRHWLFFTLSILIGLPVVGHTEVVRFEIKSREPLAGGNSFGEVGPYERIVGRVYYELDPGLPQNRPVVDLQLAPRNEQGKVSFFGDLFILAPRDLRKGNGTAFYDVNNRGNKVALRYFNYASGGNDVRTAADIGDGFLMRQGFVVVWSGWDGELLPGGGRLQLAPPVARYGDQAIVGPVRCEVIPTQDIQRSVINWDNHGSYPPTAEGLSAATLTHRVRAADPRQLVPRDQWTLHVTQVESDAAGQLPKIELEMPGGLKRGHIYEVIYEAQDPLVHGVCFTSVRDLMSAFKYGGGKGNPLLIDGRPVVRRVHGFGSSQSGRFLRELTYWGFNEDERGQQVFDGLIPHVTGGGLGSFNHRFAQPTRHGGQHDHHDYPADRFPFAYEMQRDPLSGSEDGILQRATASETAPRIMHTQSTAEYWTRAGSLVHTDPLGERDAKVPENVRIYTFGGTQHGPSSFPPTHGDGQNLYNPANYKPYLRSLLLALDRWSRDGTPPPASVYPTISSGSLVAWDQQSTGFPAIPGVRYPLVIRQPTLLDFGPRWDTKRIIDRQPPGDLGEYRVLVPRCGPDGNEHGCLDPPEVAVPLATCTGWNLRSSEAGAENELVGLRGSYIPFSITTVDRQRSKDPRPSLEQRYGTLENYLDQLGSACRQLESSGYLLGEDTERVLRELRSRAAPLFAKIEQP